MKWLFSEKLEISDNKTKTELPKESYRQKCKKYDTKIASGFGLFAFFTLVGFAIYNILRTNAAGCGISSDSLDIKIINNLEDHKCSNEKCKLTCRDINENVKSIADYINLELQNANCNSLTALILKNTVFNNTKMSPGWLAEIAPFVNKLEIKSSITGLSIIEDGAFTGHPFERLQDLTIVDVGVDVLRHQYFRSLTSLGSFAFRNDVNLRNLKIEDGALGDASRTVFSLLLSQVILTADDITKLTGFRAPALPKLKTLVLSSNSIEELHGLSFNATPNLEALHLQRCGLVKINKLAFQDLNLLKTLYLEYNLLQTLPEGTFDGLTPKDGGIKLSGNNWQCDCSLQWLQDYYINTEYIDKNNAPQCKVENREDKNFDEVIFCPDSSTSETIPPTIVPTEPIPTKTTLNVSLEPLSSTSETNPSPTTVPTEPIPTKTTSSVSLEPLPPGFMKIKCQDLKRATSTAERDVTHSVEVVINNKSVKLEFHELEGDPLEVTMTTSEDLSNYHLLWFNVENQNEIKCSSPISNGMVFDDLHRNTTYSFSLLYDGETQVSPKCIFCIKTECDWKSRPWIKNKYQIPFIALTIFISIFLICLAASITFLCIRKHPKLISGNKNVIIVKPKEDSEADITPKDYERPAYWEPYFVQSSHGYLTPKYNRYAKVRYRPPLMRSVSEWSITSGSNYNYDDPRHLHAMKMLKPLGQNSNETDDYRPPLPPPNPGFKRTSLDSRNQEHFYSSV